MGGLIVRVVILTSRKMEGSYNRSFSYKTLLFILTSRKMEGSYNAVGSLSDYLGILTSRKMEGSYNDARRAENVVAF